MERGVWYPEEGLAQRGPEGPPPKGRVSGCSSSGKREDCAACPAHPLVISAVRCLCAFLQLNKVYNMDNDANDSCPSKCKWRLAPRKQFVTVPRGQTGFASICTFISEFFAVILSIVLCTIIHIFLVPSLINELEPNKISGRCSFYMCLRVIILPLKNILLQDARRHDEIKFRFCGKTRKIQNFLC